MNYRQYIIKRKIEDVFICPFIWIGRWLAWLKPLKKEFDIFFFFPFYHTGGAEKVHAMITQAMGSPNCVIYFTRKSMDTAFVKQFVESGCTIIDISRYTDNKLLYFINLIFRGVVTGRINSQRQKPVVFNGQCNFGYKISPWVNKGVPQIELIHSFNTFSWIRIPFLPFIAATVMISRVRIEDHLRQYEKLHFPPRYKSSIQYIINGIKLPDNVIEKEYLGNLKVLYVGRGTEEKRVHLVAKIAEQSSMRNLPVEIVFMGDVAAAIPPELRSFCTLLGHKSSEDDIEAIYQAAHIVIVTSSTEGFPLVVEEGMARGCAVIATPVGDIPVHVKDYENGFLFSTVTDTSAIVEEGIRFISLLVDDRQLLKKIGRENIRYASRHFGMQAFRESYQQLFKQVRGQ